MHKEPYRFFACTKIYFIFGLLPRLRLVERTRRRFVQGLPLFVCMRFQDLFHSPPGVLFAFPSRYWFTIGRSGVFSLGGWSPHVQTGFLVPRPTHFHRTSPFVYRAITVYGGPFQTLPLKLVQLLG